MDTPSLVLLSMQSLVAEMLPVQPETKQMSVLSHRGGLGVGLYLQRKEQIFGNTSTEP